MNASVVAGILVVVGVLSVAAGRGRRAPSVLGVAAGRAHPLRAIAWGVPWRRRAAEGERVLVLVAQVAALLGAGASPAQAWWRAVGVTASDAGVPDAVALSRHVGGARTAAAVVAACRLAAEVGAPLVGVLDEVAAAVEAEARARSDREAAFAGPRTTARVLAWLPVGGIGLGAALGADPVGAALDGGPGSAAAVLGACFLLAGRQWSARLIARSRSAEDES